MAQQFRIVRCDMWRKDEWFTELEPDAKLVWIYTFTNEATSPAGIYRIALRTIANETGIPIERVREIIAMFEANDKLYYEDGVIWPVTMRKHQCGELKPKDNLVKKIQSDLAELKPSPIVERYMSFYGTLPEDTNPLPTPLEDPSEDVRLTEDRDMIQDTDTPPNEGIEMTKTEGNASSSSYAAQMTSYHNLIGFVSGKQQSDEIFTMLDDLAGQNVLDWWEMALKISADNNKRSWAYVRSVLTNCLREGHPPLIRAPNSNGSKPSAEPKYRYVEAGIGPDGKPVMRKVLVQ